jgi:hypothetical protein
VLDAGGDLYVTGFSPEGSRRSDYTTVRCDAKTGRIRWVVQYDGGSTEDQARAVAVDSGGNVYVTGTSDEDYLTVKYDRLGNELWLARYDGPAGSLDEPRDLILDGQGNAIVTGWSMGEGTGFDFLTIKYDGAGNELWVKRYSGAGENPDRAKAVAVDPGGNVYVAGTSYTPGTEEDFLIVKYSPTGGELWAAKYRGSRDSNDDLKAMALNKSREVIVTGGSSMPADYVTVKYDTDGNQIWASTFDGPGHYFDFAHALTLDDTGNVYVTGQSTWGGYYTDIVTVKYDPQGNQLWAERVSGPDYYGSDCGIGIGLDPAGSPRVAGWTEGDNRDFLLVRLVQTPPVLSLEVRPKTPVVPRGNRLEYEATLTNLTPRQITCQCWSRLRLPDGGWMRGYIVDPTTVGLGPHASQTITLRQRIPLYAPLGIYQYWGFAGPDTTRRLDADMFYFTVTGKAGDRE